MLGIREKKIKCGEKYMEVDIIPRTYTYKKKGKRSKKTKESLLSQRNINSKNAKRKLIQLIEANFTDKDYHITLTYNDEHLPNNLKEAQNEFNNYIDRIKRKINRIYREEVKKEKDKGIKKPKLEKRILKYIIITAFTPKKKDNENFDYDSEVVRVHHHLIINNVLDRGTLEELWSKRKGKGQPKKQIGIVNARRLQPDQNTGLAALAGYMMKQPSNRRKWNCSQNLTRPEVRTNDYKYSRRKIRNAVGKNRDLAFWESQYPGYYIADKEKGYEEVFNDLTGMWSIYLKLRKIE